MFDTHSLSFVINHRTIMIAAVRCPIAFAHDEINQIQTSVDRVHCVALLVPAGDRLDIGDLSNPNFHMILHQSASTGVRTGIEDISR